MSSFIFKPVLCQSRNQVHLYNFDVHKSNVFECFLVRVEACDTHPPPAYEVDIGPAGSRAMSKMGQAIILWKHSLHTHYYVVQAQIHTPTMLPGTKLVDVDIGPAGSTYFRYRYRKRARI